jgi:hypothetical protein
VIAKAESGSSEKVLMHSAKMIFCWLPITAATSDRFCGFKNFTAAKSKSSMKTHIEIGLRMVMV